MARPTFKKALTELVESPDSLLESVVAYHEGRMDASQQQAFEERLQQDDEASELLAELRSFETLEKNEDTEKASEFEVAATMRFLKRRSAEFNKVPSTSTATPRRPWLAAAALAILSLGLGSAWLDTRRELAELRSGSGFETAQIHHLTSGELRSGEEIPAIEGNGGRQILVITPTEAPEAGTLLTCVVTARDSVDVLLGPFEATATEDGLILISLEQDLPAAGEYELQLFEPDLSDDTSEPLERFRFRWSPASP